MAKFMFLYIGPSASIAQMNSAPLTQTELSQWSQQIGSALVDKGSLFGSNGADIMDTGTVRPGFLHIHGYSIVQAEDLNGALALTRNHPFIAAKNGGKGNFEIQILDITDGERPFILPEFQPVDSGILPPSLDTQLGSSSVPPTYSDGDPTQANFNSVIPPSQSGPSVTQPNPGGELEIQHEEGPAEGQTPGQTLPPVPPAPPEQ